MLWRMSETYENEDVESVSSVSGRVSNISMVSASAVGGVTLSLCSIQDGSRDSARERRHW